MNPAFRVLQVVLVLSFFVSVSFAQETTGIIDNTSKLKSSPENRNSRNSINGIQAQGDQIIFKDQSGNPILYFEEQTNSAAAMLLYDKSNFNGTHKFLSNDGGNLYWGADQLGLASGGTTYNVGDFTLGGIVFWVDNTGEHGLVCAKQDQNGGNTIRWYGGTDGVTRAKGDGPFSGEMNTTIIIAAQVAIGDDGNSYAAQVCSDLVISEGGKSYGDWYLPSKEELNLMYLNQTTINNIAIANGGSSFSTDNQNYYWSSTEDTGGNAWIQYMNSGNQFSNFKSSSRYVRAIRAF